MVNPGSPSWGLSKVAEKRKIESLEAWLVGSLGAMAWYHNTKMLKVAAALRISEPQADLITFNRLTGLIRVEGLGRFLPGGVEDADPPLKAG